MWIYTSLKFYLNHLNKLHLELNKTFFEFSELIEMFEQGKGKINKNLKENCVKSNTLIKSCEEFYNTTTVNEVLKERMGEGRQLIAENIAGISQAMDDVIKEFTREKL